MKMGVFFFSSGNSQENVYRTLDIVKNVEKHGLSFLSFPERHFDKFGGAFSNPLLYLGIAAAMTSQIELRSGSIIPALHNLIRLKEDLRLIDTISRGRLGLSFGSGWNPNDFILNPDAFYDRKNWLKNFLGKFDSWYAESNFVAKNGVGANREVEIFPKPFSTRIAIWLTISENIEAWYFAGREGYNVLTHMENVNHLDLEDRVKRYRQGRNDSGLSMNDGIVTLMQHTLIVKSDSEKNMAKIWLSNYIKDAVFLEKSSILDTSQMSGNKTIDASLMSDDVLLDVVERATAKYMDTNSLICKLDEAIQRIHILEKIGINEIACMFDFSDSFDLILRSIVDVAKLQSFFYERENVASQLEKEFCE